MSRSTVLSYGVIFFSLGILLMLFNAPMVRLVGSIGIFIGSLSLIIFNSEKYKYLKLLHISLLQRGYNITFKKQRLVCLLLCYALFFCNSFSWGCLLYFGIISKLVFNIIGVIFILFLLPVFSSPDNIERQVADENADKLIDLMNKP